MDNLLAPFVSLRVFARNLIVVSSNFSQRRRENLKNAKKHWLGHVSLSDYAHARHLTAQSFKMKLSFAIMTAPGEVTNRRIPTICPIS